MDIYLGIYLYKNVCTCNRNKALLKKGLWQADHFDILAQARAKLNIQNSNSSNQA